jgi:hypothetical protein
MFGADSVVTPFPTSIGGQPPSPLSVQGPLRHLVSVHEKCELAHILIPQVYVTLRVGNKPNGHGVKMKKLVATIALLCLPSTVLAHDIYSDLRDRDGKLCCGGQDCKPVQVTVLPDGSYYLPTTDETIPAHIEAPSPDNRFHHCIYDPWVSAVDPNFGPWDDKPKTRCFFAPMHSS